MEGPRSGGKDAGDNLHRFETLSVEFERFGREGNRVIRRRLEDAYQDFQDTGVKPTFVLYSMVVTFVAVPSSVQSAQSPPDKVVELNIYIGGLAIDDDSPFVRISGETQLLLGGRLTALVTERIAVGGSFGWFSDQGRSFEFFDPTPDLETSDLGIDVYLYSGEVAYAFVRTPGIRFFGGAGIGAATFSPDQGDGRTELLIPLLTGIEWYPYGDHSRWGLRAEARDNLIRYNDSRLGEMVLEGSTTHNLEFSFGISVLF